MTQDSTHDFPGRQGALEALESAYARLEKDNQHLREENNLLRQRIDYLIRQLYGSKSEKISPDQLELLLDGDAAKKPDASDALPASEADKPQPAPTRATRKPRTSRLRKSMEKLPVVEERIVAQEVRANPENYLKIREERSERLEVTPAVYKRRVLILEIHKRIDHPFKPPITPVQPKPLLECSVLSASLLADIQHKKYCLHQPFYRQQVELKRGHGLDVSRNMLCHWNALGAELLEPLYKILHERLCACGYLQGDETPVDYLAPGHGKTKRGYFWVIHNPTHGLIYKWHKGRARSSLEELLNGSKRPFAGHLQCDAYSVYPSLSARQPGIKLVACLAHIRRKFEYALQYQPRYSAWVIKQIAKLYAIEARLREDKEGPADNATRREVRQRHARPIHRRLGKTMIAIRALSSVLPGSPLGKALDYALKLWNSHALYLEHGELEIDNNQVENAMRPLKLGAKNWLFIGREDTGQRSAIVLTFVENIRRHGYCPREYLQWVYERIPGMNNQKALKTLMPEAWIALKKQQAHRAPTPAKVVGAE